MGETEEFAEALIDQISVELNEEKEISALATKISDDQNFPKKFTDMEDFIAVSYRHLTLPTICSV